MKGRRAGGERTESRGLTCQQGHGSRLLRDVRGQRVDVSQSSDIRELVAGQHVQGAAGSLSKIDRAPDVRGKRAHIAACVVPPADIASAVVAEEVVADVFGGKPANRWLVESAARDRAPAARLPVGVDRTGKCRIGCRTLGGRPAIIRAGDTLVDLFPLALADIVDKDPSG